MGSFIHLGIGRLEVDWAKNGIGRNHSCLFLPKDIKDVVYFYANDETELKPGYARNLRSVVKRLELLGYTLENCQALFQNQAKEASRRERPSLPFELVASVLSRIAVSRFRLPGDPSEYDFGEYVISNICQDAEWRRTCTDKSFLDRSVGEFLENLEPYVLLRLLGENPENLDLEVVWRHSDLVDGGWIDEKDVFKPLDSLQRILVVTEGSSDTNVLKHSLGLVEPDVSDFFDFIDMVENYPFTGTGNLVRFCEGLAKIEINKRVLVVLDNDTAGRSASLRLAALRLPKTIQFMTLPSVRHCDAVRTLGPAGETLENVNGRASSIEFFLDTACLSAGPPVVRWTSYDEKLNDYQGALVNKERYIRAFFDSAGRDQSYDLSGLKLLWSTILANCSRMQVGGWFPSV